MAKEIMARSADGGSIETALAVERNGIQWLIYSPDIQSMLDMYRETPDQLTKDQRESNIASDAKG